jgi:thioredoxin 1
MGLEILNADNFTERIEASPLPVLVDFYADWCQPCRRLSPLLEEIANENQGKLQVYKVDTEADPALAHQYNIRGIPHIISFKDGQVYKSLTGAAPKEQLMELVR